MSALKVPILATIITSVVAFSIPTPNIDFGKVAQAGAAAVTIASTVGVSPVLAGDRLAGEKIFNANCATCHAAGQNVIIPKKTLEKDALEQYLAGGRTEAAVIMQVANGKNAMPAYGGRLGEEQIQDVSTYVIATSEKGWDDTDDE